MAKLTDRQKNNILAKWHTGQYTKVELAKQYKISEAMIRKICDNQPPKNAHIVEAGLILEIAKKCDNSATEVQTINNAIKEGYDRLSKVDEYKQRVDNLQLDLLDGIRAILDKGTVSKPMKLKMGDIDTISHEECELTPGDYRTMIGAVDEAAKTIGAADRHAPKIDINNTNAQQNNTDNSLKISFE